MGQQPHWTPSRAAGIGLAATPKPENNFNFLRLLLATLVIVAHSPELIDGNRGRELLTRLFRTEVSFGDLAVDGFFLLSGFLITRSWISLPRLGPFLRKRILRIYPGFVVASLVSAFVFGPLGGNSTYWTWFSPGRLLFTTATLDVPGVPDAFPSLPYPGVNGSLWTIRFEFACYLCIAALGCSRLIRCRALILGLFVTFTAIHVLQCLGDIGLPVLESRLRFLAGMPRFLSFFLAGACFSRFADEIRYTRQGVLVASNLLIPSMFFFPLCQVTMPILGGYLLFAWAFAESRLLRGFGGRVDVSYGVYLYAWPIQSLIITRFRSIDPYLLMIVTFVLSAAAGFLSWHLVERHFLRLKPKTSAGPPRSLERELVPLRESRPIG